MRGRRRAPGAGPAVEGFSQLVEIGHGSFSTVHRAVEDATGRPVALKVLDLHDLDREVRAAFDVEARALGHLAAHPHVVTLYRTATSADGRPVLVLELCQGSLAQRLRATGPLAAAEVVAIGVKLAGALESAHRAGFLHRDVKPHNVLVTAYGEPALADFGVAALHAAADDGGGGSFGLTTVHAPPEVLSGGSVGPASDVYALASTLHQLLTGRAPFAAHDGEAPAAVILRILSAPVPPILSPAVPLALSDALVAALAKEPTERTPSAAALGEALLAVAAAEGWPASPMVVTAPAAEADLPPGAEAPSPGPRLGSAPTAADDGRLPGTPTWPGAGSWSEPEPLPPQRAVVEVAPVAAVRRVVDPTAASAGPGPASAAAPGSSAAQTSPPRPVAPAAPVVTPLAAEVLASAAVAPGVPDVWDVDVSDDPDAVTVPPARRS